MATEEFRKDSKSAESLAIALCKGFLATDADLQNDPEFSASSDEMGSTGIVALITPTDIICANVGTGIFSLSVALALSPCPTAALPSVPIQATRAAF